MAEPEQLWLNGWYEAGLICRYKFATMELQHDTNSASFVSFYIAFLAAIVTSFLLYFILVTMYL